MYALIERTEVVKKRLDPEMYYAVGEAAQQLGVKASTIKDWLRTLRLDGRKVKKVGFREEWEVLGESIIKLQGTGVGQKSK